MSTNPPLRDLISQAERLIAAGNIDAATALVKELYAKNRTNPDVLVLVAQVSTDSTIRRNALTKALQGDPNHVRARALLNSLDTPFAPSQAASPPPSSVRPAPSPIPQPTTSLMDRATPDRTPATRRSWLIFIPVAIVLGIVAIFAITSRGGNRSGSSGTPELVVVRFFEAQMRGDSGTMLSLVTTEAREALKTYDTQGGIAKVLVPAYPIGTVTNVRAMPAEPGGEGRVSVVLRLNGTAQGLSGELCQNNELIRSGTTWELNKFDNFKKCNDVPLRATPAAFQATSVPVSSLEPTAQALAAPLTQTVAAITQTVIAGAPQYTQQALIAQQTLLAERLGSTQTAQAVSVGLDAAMAEYGTRAAVSDTKVAAYNVGLTQTAVSRNNDDLVTASSRAVTLQAPTLAAQAAETQRAVFAAKLPGQIFYPQQKVFTVDKRTGNPVDIDLPRAEALSVSPDGKRIAYTLVFGESGLTIANVDGTGARVVTDKMVDDLGKARSADRSFRHPSWSPDGKQLVVVGYNPVYAPHVYIIDAEGKTWRRLVEGDGGEDQPAWSPDGTRIAFVRKGQLFVIDPTGKNERSLNLKGEMPAWSADGKALAYVVGDSNEGSIFVSDADGRNARRITPDTESNAWPTWSPDGRSLLFSHYVEKTRNWQLVVLNLDTNTRVVVVDPSGYPRGHAAWVK